MLVLFSIMTLTSGIHLPGSSKSGNCTIIGSRVQIIVWYLACFD